MTVLTDADLYLRGAETLLASWEQYACRATGAAVQCSRGRRRRRLPQRARARRLQQREQRAPPA